MTPRPSWAARYALTSGRARRRCATRAARRLLVAQGLIRPPTAAVVAFADWLQLQPQPTRR